MNEDAVFAEALAKNAPVERAAYLDEVCGQDTQLRNRIETLLRSHEEAGSFLGKPAIQCAAEELAGNVTGNTTEAEHITRDIDQQTLSFLSPSEKPESLGRLGHYEILEVIGRGGSGIVLRAFDDKLHRVVAIKALLPELATTSPPRKRFLREARSAAAVRHEHVVDIHAVEEQPIPYLVMEYVCGETLQQKHERVGPFEVREVLRLGQQIARGLAAAHEHGLIHRDIKPSNIVLEKKAEERVKITDFGLARAVADASLTQSGVIAGTPMYMAPEQTVGDSIDHRADLFSLGSVLYTMCSGRPPFRATSTMATLKRVAEDAPRPIREIIPEVPEWLCNIIAKLQAKKPEDRFQSAQEVADLLGRCLTNLEQGKPVVLEPNECLIEPFCAVKSRGRGRWAIPAAVLLVLVGAILLTEATGVTNVRATVTRLFTADVNGPGESKLVVDVNAPGVKVLETKRSAEPARSKLMAPWSNSTTWVIEGEELVQPDDSLGFKMLLFGDTNWTDYDFESEVKITSGWQIGFDFRAIWQGHHMSAEIGRAGNTRHSITERSGANYSEVCAVPGKTTLDRWYRVRVEARGNTFKLFLDGELVTAAYQEGFPRGRVGFSMNRVSARFRNLKVTDPDGKVLLEGVHNVLPKAKNAGASKDKLGPLITPWSNSDHWVLEGEELVQPTDPPDWHVLLFGDPSWTDYAYEAEVKISAGQDRHEIGLVFRARGAEDRAYASIGAFANTRYAFIGIRGGARALGQIPGKIVEDCWYRVRVEALGTKLNMDLDGTRVVSINSGEYVRGCVGIVTNCRARFRNLKVTDPNGKVLLEGVQNVLPKPPGKGTPASGRIP